MDDSHIDQASEAETEYQMDNINANAECIYMYVRIIPS